ncbi:DNA polymerase-3 subunit delta' [Motilibacter rhizosphaerae]|uniref:DNA polymerase III subunit delta' n=1 Tax=Motilibacter rhizosphaerae TaxID=598652 RepID=A0A4Q7NA83_9ACTN|nr:DNA polymerase III subunit delta' [Motilibacter rhizosphaerae]RZS79403.1 DNA polymerase-3 subunit delta' [Motilibacter rhizosphaerae]
MSVWDRVVGQERAVVELQSAVQAAEQLLRGGTGTGMTHAWLFTGPPGSGRSVAAGAFAAALQCERGGCGTCASCRTALAGSHADIEVVSTRLLSIGVAVSRELVQKAARRPSQGRWQVLLVEDVDRLTEQAANTLLKVLEEPPPRTVWLLCAPSLEDALPTIRSRCRHVLLRTPPVQAVADLLVARDGIDPAMAVFAARAAQGHIGRARRLATDEQARLRRNEALRIPGQLRDIGSCLQAAANLVEATKEEAGAQSAELDAKETEELARALGKGTTGRGMVTGAAGQLKELERQQRTRAKRTRLDALDRALVDLVSFYRDVLAVQFGAPVALVNEEMRPAVEQTARALPPEGALRCIEAILECRTSLEANAAELLAVEALAVKLRAA